MQTLCGECECGSNMQAVAFSSTIAAAVLSGQLEKQGAGNGTGTGTGTGAGAGPERYRI